MSTQELEWNESRFDPCLYDDGTFQYYVFTVLIFGFSDAAYIVDQLIKPIKSFVQNFGIYFLWYIDDGKIISNSYSSCKMHVEFVLKIVQFSGWYINWNNFFTPSPPRKIS